MLWVKTKAALKLSFGLTCQTELSVRRDRQKGIIRDQTHAATGRCQLEHNLVFYSFRSAQMILKGLTNLTIYRPRCEQCHVKISLI